jgi:2-methylisocitrate lyase-like PEP mutase family enzyme
MTTNAALFRELHQGLLRLPNAWDVASALIIERAGAAAIATTSAGVAWSLGTADGNHLERDRAVDAVARIVAAVGVPVTADIESGFAADADGVAETVRRVVAAGAVGINIEDSGVPPLRPIADQCERLAAARQGGGAELFINARIDTFLFGVAGIDETVARATAYLDSGADGIFVPGVADSTTIKTLVDAIPAPLNVMAGPGFPTVAELGELGVARISVGPAITLAAYDAAERAARELLTDGTYRALEGRLDFGTVNALLNARR